MSIQLFSLKGKRALVTGSSQGIGYALAEGLAGAGAEIVLNGRDRKILVFKKKRRKGYAKKQGHRQPFTEVLIKEISA